MSLAFSKGQVCDGLSEKEAVFIWSELKRKAKRKREETLSCLCPNSDA